MKTTLSYKTLGYALVVMVLFLSFTGFAQTEKAKTLYYPDAEIDLATAKATVKAYEEGNWEALRTNLKEDAKIYGLGNFDTLTVDQSISYWKKGMETATPILDEDGTWLGVSIPEGPKKGDWILHWGINTLTYKNGEVISFPFHIALKMEDHKISKSYFYYDNMKIIRELGYALSPPLEEKREEENDLDLNIEH